MKIELTMEEAKVLHNLIDMAVRANGVNVAIAAGHMAAKIDQAARTEIEEQAHAANQQQDSSLPQEMEPN